MSISDDTDALLATSVWGEAVTIVRNTPTYDGSGSPADSWASVATPNADIQPAGGSLRQAEVGEERKSTHVIFLPNGTAIRIGDRIRPAGWVAGNDEYEVNAVLSDEGHVEVHATMVAGHA